MTSRSPVEDVSERIRSIRLRLGLTQEQLAARLGVSFMSVSRWENGHAKPLPAFMKALEELEKHPSSLAAKGKGKKTTLKA